MMRSESKTFLESASRNERLLARRGVREQRRLCLVCGASIGSGDRTMQIHGALVHIRCAAYRRRLVR